ncbi:nucleoprotein TPR [Anopheles maculipalpis]|uniref:nucleoprotein TPR n=1 Tax=Anopheles maculipalpis TaxID=1496333 RepID=UPI0021597DCF|nr:nucleoprotein TPR [Anopheles maculipalpis]
MEVDQASGVLHSILTPEEIEAIGEASIKKIEDACEKKFEEFLMAKALCETRKTEFEIMKTDYERKIEELTLRAEDESAKYHSSQLSVKEMRIELEDVKQELIKAKEKLSLNEVENDRFRKERNQALVERDTMDSALKRKELEVERLHYDVLELEKKIKSANAAKCEALTKLEEIVSKEHSLEFKEKRMDQELSMRDNQIARLTQDLDQTLRELQSIRRDQNIKSLTMEAKVAEKNEELKIANQTYSFLSEQNVELSAKVEDLATKNLKLSNEMSAMMEHYRKERDSQNRLCELLQQDKHDHMQQTKELETAITALRQMLNEATESCGVLETEKKQLELKHADELANRDKTIGDLRDELKHANELLADAREENVEHAVERLAPSAAGTSRLLKSGMSVTEVYSLYVRTLRTLQQEQKEHEKLKLQTQNILQELEQNAPQILRQQTENQNLKEANEQITMQLNSMITETSELQAEISALRNKLRVIERENTNLRQQKVDLSRQVCHLLMEVENIQRGVVSQDADQSTTTDTTNSTEVISKKMVTYSNIQELQNNNVRLLLVVRDFTDKLEELERIQNSMNSATYEAKLDACYNRIHELMDTVDQNRHLLEHCSQQRDRYIKMYHDAMRSYNPDYTSASMNGGNNMQSDELMDGLDGAPLANSSTANEANGNASGLAAVVAEKDRKLAELESKQQVLQHELSTIKQEYEAYRAEKLSYDKQINEQMDKMRTEIRELSSSNVKLAGTNEFNAEQNRLISKNITTYKSQITALEERNRNYEGTIVKHEASIMYLKEEAMSAQSKLARAEVQLENLKEECRILKDSETRLRTEREILNRERCNQNLLLNNLEMIKVSMERSENEGRLRLETRLDETSRECSALRRRLQEEQDLYREQMACLQRQLETAQKRMEEEIAIAEGHQAELRDTRNELEIKTRKIDDLQRKLQESLSPNDEDNPVTQAKRKIRELENSLAESGIEINSLQTQLATAQEHVKKYAELSDSTVKELRDVTELSNKQKEASDKELAELRKCEADLRTQIDELKTELSLKITGEKLTTGDKDSELHKVQLELKATLEKVADQAREMRETRENCNALAEKLHEAEHKYAREMMEHSSDIQQLAQLKEDMQRTQAQFEELQKQRDQAQEHLKTGEDCWNSREQKLRTEVSQLEEQLNNLNSQNAALHDQIQNLGTRLSISAAAQNQTLTETDTTNVDNSMIGEDSSILNRSFNDEDKHSVEQLLQIIKYLRKEKDIAVARTDMLRSENVRIQSELMILEKKFEEVQAELKEMREKTDTVTVTAAKHEEILRKLDTYNAIVDSNRVLREERDGLNQKVRELSQRLLDAEDKLFPLEEKVQELTVKLESSTNENTTLRMDVARQRQRMTSLVERSSKINSDDWKRMQTERENLAKMLVAEKELLKHANEELNTHKVERTRLEGELSSVNKQLQACNAQVKKLTEDLEATATQTVEFETLKTKLKTTEEQLAEVRIKESQIRKIAKRYKDSFTELKRQTDEREGDAAGSANVSRVLDSSGTGATVGGAASSGNEENAVDMEDMRKQVETAAEEIDTLKKENELLRAQLEKAERSMDVMKDAKTRIIALTEQKNNATRELSAVKGQLQQQLDQMREETDLLKAQYEGRVTRCEKESADADRESKDTINRLTRENEQLTIRLNQLNRQLGLQQAVAKPTTSAVGAVGVSEKPAGESPRTANVKPMAGPSQQQSATVTPRRVSETPLASIRPMAVGSRTAAVLPTSQTSSTNVAIVQGSSAASSASSVSTSPAPGVGGVSAGTSASNIAASTASSAGGSSSAGAGSAGSSGSTSSVSGTPSTSGLTTALVPPQQQQVHSVTATSSSSGVSNALGLNESITASSSPTSSHTDYMPATSSASVAVAAVPPMGTASTSTAESSSSSSSSTSPHTEGESSAQMGASSDQTQQQQQQVQQAAVAMVMPHVEGGVAQQQSQQQPQALLSQQQQQSTVQMQPLQQQQQSTPQASSSNTVTTTQAGHKRPRDVEGDSSTDNAGQQLAIKPTPAKKRVRMVQVTVDGFQGVTESGLDVEYQVPTSSQRDQEDDIIVVDSEEEDEDDDEDEDEEEEDVGMADEGTAEADDGPFGEYETEELGVAGGIGAYDEGEGPDIDEDNNIQSANNEVDVDEDNEIPNPCGTTSTTSTSTSSTSSSTLSSTKQMASGPHATPMDTTEDVDTSSTSSTTTVPTAGGSSVAVPGPSTSMQSSTSSSSMTSSSVVESGASTSSNVGGNTSNDAQQLPQIQSTTGTSHNEASTGQQSTSSSSTSSSSIALSSTAASSSGTGTASGQMQGGATATGSGVSATRQIVNPLSRQQQQASHLILMQQNYEHHESADDRIVPSTPTLYAPRRTDGFSVGSPHPQVPNARFTFSETSTSRQSVGVVPTSGGAAGSVSLPEGIDDTRIDLSQLDETAAGGGGGGGGSSGGGRSVPTTPQHTTHSEHISMGGMAVAGPSNAGLSNIERSSSGGGESQVPDILVSGASIGDGYIPESTTSTIDPLHPTYSSEALASTADATGSEALDRSERELLEEDDDDLVDDGVAVGDSATLEAETNDVDEDTRTAVSETTTAAPTTSGNVETATRTVQKAAGSASDSAGASGSRSNNEADTGTGDDRISSEGEALTTTSRPMEEGSEAEVLEAPSSNTRSRTSSAQRVSTNVGGRHGRRYSHRGANRTPITWNEGRAASLNRSGSKNQGSQHYQPPHMQQQQQQQQQQHQPSRRANSRSRGRRMNPYRYQ